MKLKTNAFALTVGIIFAVWAVIHGVTVLLGWHSEMLNSLMDEFHLFTISNGWSLILTALEHFVTGYITGLAFAWVYNRLA